MLYNVDEKSIYYIQTRIKDSNYGHALGLHLLSDGKVEFYDPEYGIFVFPKMTHFECWFQYLYAEYSSKEGGKMLLINMGKQPNNTTTSLPLFKEYSEEEAIRKVMKTATLLCNSLGDNGKKWDAVFAHIYHAAETASNLLAKTTNSDLSATLEKQLKMLDRLTQEKFSTTFLSGSWELDEESEMERSLLKLKVLNLIDKKIKKFKLSMFNKDKFDALTELHQRIRVAPEGVTLKAVVNHWLMDKPEQGAQSYGDIIQMHYANQQWEKESEQLDFIYRLINDLEISPFRLRILQCFLLVKIGAIKNQWDSEHFGAQVQRVFMDTTLTSPLDKLNALKQISLGKKVPSFFEKTRINENKKYQKELIKIFKKLDPHCPSSLLSATAKLEHVMKKMNENKIQPERKRIA